jgi:hypothetical protein
VIGWASRIRLQAKRQQASNFSVRESREAADDFFTDEMRERVTGLYGVSPIIELVEIAQCVANSGSSSVS